MERLRLAMAVRSGRREEKRTSHRMRGRAVPWKSGMQRLVESIAQPSAIEVVLLGLVTYFLGLALHTAMKRLWSSRSVLHGKLLSAQARYREKVGRYAEDSDLMAAAYFTTIRLSIGFVFIAGGAILLQLVLKDMVQLEHRVPWVENLVGSAFIVTAVLGLAAGYSLTKSVVFCSSCVDHIRTQKGVD